MVNNAKNNPSAVKLSKLKSSQKKYERLLNIRNERHIVSHF